MAVSPTKTDAKKLIPILAPDFKELGPEAQAKVLEVAVACMEESFRVAQAKSKFTVVGQIYWTESDGSITSHDPAAEKICLGVFSSEATARTASDQLHGHAGSKELFRTWTLPICHDSPAQWRKARKAALEAAERAGDRGTQGDRLSALVEASAASQRHCSGMAPNDEGNFLPCARPEGHPGVCFHDISSPKESEC